MITLPNHTIYKCEYCRKKYERKGACEKHEGYCYKKPGNSSACSGCSHLEEYQKEVYYDTYAGEASRMVKAFRCTKLEKGLYPLKVLRGDMLNKFPETFEGEELMPSECEHYSYFNI